MTASFPADKVLVIPPEVYSQFDLYHQALCDILREEGIVRIAERRLP